MSALHGRPCAGLAGRVLHIRYSVPAKPKAPVGGSLPVATSASELGVPGIYLVPDFVTAAEEQVGGFRFRSPPSCLSLIKRDDMTFYIRVEI